MSLFKRFLFYFGGVSIGIILLYFFIGGSGASCEYNYFPDARVLKNIRLKERAFDEGTLEALANMQLDTAAISFILKEGDVNFSESKKDHKPCAIYSITGEASRDSGKELKLTIKNCEEKATIQKVELLD